jgi:hypothetical protein
VDPNDTTTVVVSTNSTQPVDDQFLNPDTDISQQ